MDNFKKIQSATETVILNFIKALRADLSAIRFNYIF